MPPSAASVVVLFNHVGEDEYERLRAVDPAALPFTPEYDIHVATVMEIPGRRPGAQARRLPRARGEPEGRSPRALRGPAQWHPHDTCRIARRSKALLGGGAKRIEAQHKKGELTARELFDLLYR